MNKGFTLFELLITIVILGIIAIPLGVTTVEHMQAAVQPRAYAAAVNLARFKMEEFNNMAYINIASGTDTTTDPDYSIASTVTETTSGLEAFKQIDIQVTRAGGSAVLFSVSTIVTKNITYGL